MAFDTRLLTGLGVLAAVVEAGSFVRAADALGMSDSGVSRAVARLETRLGVRLLDRTTRSSRLTDEGRRFYDAVAPLLGEVEHAAALASGASAAVRGRLRVDVDGYLARRVLARALPAFMDEHPELEVEILTRETIGDLVGDGIDVALRFGSPPRRSVVAVKLLETRIVTVAAPAYLDRYPRPSRPEDLARHDCVEFRDPATGRPFSWEFRRGSEVVPVATSGRLILTDADLMLNACLAGGGVAQVMAFGIEDLLAGGQLVDLFPDWPDEVFPLYATHPSRRHVPAKVRAFLRFCRRIVT
jgi:DNA-binding transcriptional LysR family regulator